MKHKTGVFSNRNYDALRNKTIIVSLPLRLRGRIWIVLAKHNEEYQTQEGMTDTLCEVKEGLKDAHGCSNLEIVNDKLKIVVGLEEYINGTYPNLVLDAIELFFKNTPHQAGFQEAINDIMIEEKSPWLLCDGYFFKLDSDFLNAQILKAAHKLLTDNNYAGPLDEFTEARKDLTAGNHKDAIHNACKAFESVLKTIEQKPRSKVGDLIHGLPSNFHHGLPDKIANEFGDKVLYALPFLRNEISGHGQGKSVIKDEACKNIANLAVNLAGCFIVFLIQRHLELGSHSGTDPNLKNSNCNSQS